MYAETNIAGNGCRNCEYHSGSQRWNNDGRYGTV